MKESGKDDQILPRREPDGQYYSAVDSALKDLQRISRRTKEVQDSLLDDLCLLQRLHYKGQNQHRAAIFWKRTQEVRRVLHRVSGYDIVDLVESIARGCHAQKLERRQLWRTAWTQLPARKYLTACDSLLNSLLLLLSKGVQVCETTYSILVVQMRSAAFLPLILSFSAIVARIRALMAELEPLLRQTLETSQVFARVHTQVPSTQAKDERDSPENCVPSPAQPKINPPNAAHPTSASTPKPLAKKKKKSKNTGPRDEIDEIFGF